MFLNSNRISIILRFSACAVVRMDTVRAVSPRSRRTARLNGGLRAAAGGRPTRPAVVSYVNISPRALASIHRARTSLLTGASHACSRRARDYRMAQSDTPRHATTPPTAHSGTRTHVRGRPRGHTTDTHSPRSSSSHIRTDTQCMDVHCVCMCVYGGALSASVTPARRSSGSTFIAMQIQSGAFIKLFAGAVILLGIGLGAFVNQYCLIISVFAALNLMQSAVTSICLPLRALRAIGWMDGDMIVFGGVKKVVPAPTQPEPMNDPVKIDIA
jgi:hypothetical protein